MTRSLFSTRSSTSTSLPTLGLPTLGSPTLISPTLSAITFAILTASSALGITALTSIAAPNTAYAKAPMAKTSAPAFYRVMLGDFEVTAISDGTVPLPMDKLLTNTKLEKTLRAFQENHLQSPVATSVNAYLINTGEKLVLIDTGAAGLFGPTLGRLIKNLKASGYSPEQIDEVYLTHMHGDHMGGLMTGDKMTFPNAIVRADQHDADFWLNPSNMKKASDADKGGFQGAMKSLNPYVKSGQFKPFVASENNAHLVSGIKAIASYGHTPGHTIYAVESKGKKLMLWGDLMHVAAVQFADPSITISFDSDSKKATVQRLNAYQEAAKNGYMIGATHLSFPGLGYVRSEGKKFVWIALNYETVD